MPLAITVAVTRAARLSSGVRVPRRGCLLIVPFVLLWQSCAASGFDMDQPG